VVAVLAVAAALANAIASFLQRLGVEDAPRDASMSAGLIAHMLRRPVWFAGFGCMGFGFLFQALALHSGTLAVVQPLLTTEMLFVVLILWAWYGFHVRSRDWLYSALTLGGLATFLIELAPTDQGHPPSNATWATAIALTAAVMAVGVLVARRGPPWWRALVLGAAASVGFAMTAALTKAFSDSFGQGVGHVLASWETYGMCVVGLASFLLMQNAFHAGPFAASQSTLILINPFVSVGLGAWLYGESFQRGADVVVIGVLSAVVFVAGAVGLCTSPLIAGVHGEDDVQLLHGRGYLARRRLARQAG
jgi:drug/metabolite transporter (DMT)-like permease